MNFLYIIYIAYEFFIYISYNISYTLEQGLQSQLKVSYDQNFSSLRYHKNRKQNSKRKKKKLSHK